MEKTLTLMIVFLLVIFIIALPELIDRYSAKQKDVSRKRRELQKVQFKVNRRIVGLLSFLQRHQSVLYASWTLNILTILQEEKLDLLRRYKDLVKNGFASKDPLNRRLLREVYANLETSNHFNYLTNGGVPGFSPANMFSTQDVTFIALSKLSGEIQAKKDEIRKTLLRNVCIHWNLNSAFLKRYFRCLRAVMHFGFLAKRYGFKRELRKQKELFQQFVEFTNIPPHSSMDRDIQYLYSKD